MVAPAVVEQLNSLTNRIEALRATFLQATRPSAAARVLSSRRFPVTVYDAKVKLLSFHGSVRIYPLYEKYFPEDWQYWTQNPEKLRAASLISDLGECYTEIERQFFDLVHEAELFPYDWEYHLELLHNSDDRADGRVEHIPLNPVCYDTEWGEWTDIPVGVLFIAFLLGMEKIGLSTFRATMLTHQGIYPLLETIELEEWRGWEINLPKLEKLCKEAARQNEENKPLEGLPDAIRMLTHNTGHWWLDMDRESYAEEYFEWKLEDFDFLVYEWRQAEPIVRRVEILADWLDDHNNALKNLEKVIELWQEAGIWD